MKHDIGATRPDHLKESWPGEFAMFSHLEAVAGIPSPLSLITTRKPDGRANACFHGWSAYTGDANGYYVLLTGLYGDSHTRANIERDRAFCVNYLAPRHYDACLATIEHNREDVDELEIAGLHAEDAATVDAPRVAEAFLTLECALVAMQALPGTALPLVVGRVTSVAVDEAYAGIDAACGEDGFMLYAHAPYDMATGERGRDAVAVMRVVREM